MRKRRASKFFRVAMMSSRSDYGRREEKSPECPSDGEDETHDKEYAVRLGRVLVDGVIFFLSFCRARSGHDGLLSRF